MGLFTKKKTEKSQKEQKAVRATEPKAKSAAAKADTLLIKQPWITEKSTRLVGYNQYLFTVNKECTKNEAKKAIEGIYSVTITNIRSINIPGKKRRFGASRGIRPGHRKVIVTLKKGQSIDILPH